MRKPHFLAACSEHFPKRPFWTRTRLNLFLRPHFRRLVCRDDEYIPTEHTRHLWSSFCSFCRSWPLSFSMAQQSVPHDPEIPKGETKSPSSSRFFAVPIQEENGGLLMRWKPLLHRELRDVEGARTRKGRGELPRANQPQQPRLGCCAKKAPMRKTDGRVRQRLTRGALSRPEYFTRGKWTRARIERYERSHPLYRGAGGA